MLMLLKVLKIVFIMAATIRCYVRFGGTGSWGFLGILAAAGKATENNLSCEKGHNNITPFFFV